MAMNKTFRYAIYYAIVTPIVLLFLPFLLVWFILNITKGMIEEFGIWLQKKLHIRLD